MYVLVLNTLSVIGHWYSPSNQIILRTISIAEEMQLDKIILTELLTVDGAHAVFFQVRHDIPGRVKLIVSVKLILESRLLVFKAGAIGCAVWSLEWLQGDGAAVERQSPEDLRPLLRAHTAKFHPTVFVAPFAVGNVQFIYNEC